jgi:hypothetical protein
MRVNSVLRWKIKFGASGRLHTRARIRREISQLYHKMLWRGIIDDGENGYGRGY